MFSPFIWQGNAEGIANMIQYGKRREAFLEVYLVVNMTTLPYVKDVPLLLQFGDTKKLHSEFIYVNIMSLPKKLKLKSS